MKNLIIPYNPRLKALARELRKNSTLAEVLLWQKIKNKQILDAEFHRQVPINEYIVDFYCHELRLVIEIDGESHQNKMEEDQVRQSKLESFEIVFLRFTDLEVKQKIDFVLNEIYFKIKDLNSQT